jgi:serine/threonine protein kinase
VSQQGKYLGQYRLLNLVGNGRHCQVWEAMHDGRNERYALKVLHPDYRDDSEQLNLMKHEFAVGSEMDHPRVVRIFEFDSSRIAPFLAMEFFASATNLKKLIAQGIDVIARQIPKIVEQAAEGLAYFHQQGWIHRDIKPNNFLANPAADVKLIDFAIAERRRGLLSRLFGKSRIQGTRSYMSPEQIRGQALDHRTDIYSFGCVTFELLAGRPPFTGNSENELLNKHLRSPAPSAETFNKNLTYECVQMVKSMLAKKPEDRPASMDEVLDHFRAYRVYRSMPAAPKA